jgi:ATPase subunit of ABC transporter with duplicated ATPase domains
LHAAGVHAAAGSLTRGRRRARGRLGQLVDALGIDPDRATRSTSPSPGETRKLALALGLVREPQVILLDEPTNHLDLDSTERLEAALAGYPGALVVISHDARFAEALCDTTWTIADGTVRFASVS